ncbi:MAG: type I glyceraldehyde-3-phosphate dehydrogenase [Promethearchaeota archaeon]
MTVKVGINGFGRIGRLVLRALFQLQKEANQKVDIVAINDIADNEPLAHMFEFDSVHGRFDGTVEVEGQNALIFDGDYFKTYKEREPSQIPWKELEADIVLESTGKFRSKEGMQKHITAGAKKVLLSAPAKPITNADITLVRGVNNHHYDPKKHTLISNASCTTNCLAPVVKVLDDKFGFEQGIMTTIHSYTNNQRLLDSIHKDYRRMRAAAVNHFPTTTGASEATGEVLPHLKGKIDGLAVRVPTPNVSIVDLTARLKQNVSCERIESAFREAAEGDLKGILDVEWRSLVSTDYNGNPHSAIVDLPFLHVVDTNMCKILAWYDNEWGYAMRCAEMIHEIYEKGIN